MMPWTMLVVVSLGACVAPDTTEIGPTIDVILVHPNGDATSMDADPHLTLGTKTSYSFEVDVHTVAGTGTCASEMFPAETVTVTIMPIGVSLMADAFYVRNILDERTFEQNVNSEVPATMMGSSLMLHAEAADGRGLHSNTIDVTIALR
ncbi:MAG: hypothetical protein NT062_37800 [Proteobacteria bacterium]|nr:hypothetical protein [Pseudomonadota bacterium]